MGNISDYAAAKVLDHSLGKTSWTMPANAYVGLKTADPGDNNAGGTEPTINTGGYARVQCTGATWDSAATRATSNVAAITFPISTAAWSTGATNLTHFVVMDAATNGNLLYHGSLAVARAVNAAGVTLQFAIGELDVLVTAS